MNTAYEHFDLDRLKAVSIVEVARRLGCRVWRTGVSHKMLCPWHDDHDPSLGLVTGTDKNFCHCYVCGKGGSTIDLVMQSEKWTFKEACQWLSDTFSIGMVKGGNSFLRPRVKAEVKEEEPDYSYIPMPMVDKLVTVENSLCHCLMQMFQPEAVVWVAEEYRIGSYSLGETDNYTVFPSIDRERRVRNLKIQHYDTDPASPRFGHCTPNSTFWLASMWQRDHLLPQGARYGSSGLFGEHLLRQYPSATVALVESPKNVLFGALAFPEMLWVATGNKGSLNRSVLQPLHGRDVIVIPDRDAIPQWTDIVGNISDLANFTVSDFCLRHAPEGQPKYDIADYIQQERTEGRNP